MKLKEILKGIAVILGTPCFLLGLKAFLNSSEYSLGILAYSVITMLGLGAFIWGLKDD